MRLYHRSPGLALEQCRLLVELGKQHDLSAESCLRDTDITTADFSIPNCEPSAAQELLIIQNLCSQTSLSPARLGYLAGRQSNLHNFGLIGQAMLSSDNLLHALNIALRYCREVFHFTNCTSQKQGNALKVTWHAYQSDTTEVEQFVVARDLGTCISIIESVIGEKPKGILTASAFFTDSALMTELSEQLGCKLALCNSGAELSIDATSLLKPMPQRNPQTCQMLEQFCYDQLYKPQNQPFTDSFTEQVACLLKNAKFSLSRDDASNSLHISSRTLARHLLNEKTTWRELVAKIRIDQAKQLLASNELTIELVAEQVGFGSSSAFSLAFRRATGTTPREFRKQFSPTRKMLTQFEN